MNSGIDSSLLLQFCSFLDQTMGLHYGKDNLSMIEPKLASISKAFGFEDKRECIQFLMKAPLSKKQVMSLAKILTVGETYFFRDIESYKTLERSILVPLINERALKEKTLRIWSAGCCTGQEIYTIAILLCELIPNISEWKIVLIGTDINAEFIQGAERANYKEWSFRETPKEIKTRYFRKEDDGSYTLNASIKKMVKFSYLNLVENSYPSIINDLHSMDLILCKNVLIYFSPKQIDGVIRKLTHSLQTGGFLFTTAIEAPFVQNESLFSLRMENQTVFRKDKDLTNLAKTKIQQNTIKVELPAFLNLKNSELNFDFSKRETLAIKKLHTGEKQMEAILNQKIKCDMKKVFLERRYSEVTDVLENALAHLRDNPIALQEHMDDVILLIQSYANQGKPMQALSWCAAALLADKINPRLYYYQAMIFYEQECIDESINALKKALFLDSAFVMAEFHLGHLFVLQGKKKEAIRHFRNVVDHLKDMSPNEIVKDSDGLTASAVIAMTHLFEEAKGV